MDEVQTQPVVSRVAVFVAALVLVAVTGWTAGRVSNPPVPVPHLPRPAVMGGPGNVAGADRVESGQGGAVVVVPEHGVPREH